jgi:hypothetical protein
VPDPRATVPTYPEDLWAIVRRALARDRDERYTTAHELARDLDAFVARRRGEGDADGDRPMPALSSAILDALFPGERAKRASWLRQANAQRLESAGSVPPPSMRPSSMPPSVPARSAPPAKKPRSLPKIRVPRG